ncbi:5067_t:CDS:2 [Racocetra persica]|uniref:5067_t:CDS:1 n=1 Tax=Racocetra persica TaxID=160502 RepID=A0ACA9RH49_9GLOM|nr:5067_t:CDS:2 [Racocetra persica]
MISALPKQQDIYDDIENDSSSNKEGDKEGDKETDQEDTNKEDENDLTESESSDDKEPREGAEESDESVEESDINMVDPIYELFQESLLMTHYVSRPAKDEHPRCSNCGVNPGNPKKSSKYTKDNKNKRKRVKA